MQQHSSASARDAQMTPAQSASFRTQLNELLRMADGDTSDQLTSLKLLCEFIATSSRGPPSIAERNLEVIAREFMPTFHRFLTTTPDGQSIHACANGGDAAASVSVSISPFSAALLSPNVEKRHPSSLILHIVQSLALLSRPIVGSAPATAIAACARILRIIIDEFGCRSYSRCSRTRARSGGSKRYSHLMHGETQTRSNRLRIFQIFAILTSQLSSHKPSA